MSGRYFSGTITYDIVDINEGAGFDKTTGKFTAPEGGTYGFTFTGMTLRDESWALIRYYKDGSLHHIYNGWGNNFSSSWMMKLSQGEEVNLGVAYGKLYVHSAVPVIFTGSLLKLDD